MSVPLGDVVLEATDIEKFFGAHHVLRGVSLAVRKHETVMLIGRSGSGKTTFLRCLNFLEEPTVGSVAMGDLRIEADPLQEAGRERKSDIRHLRQQTGMVFQEFNLWWLRCRLADHFFKLAQFRTFLQVPAISRLFQ